jgi:hypothetical protein
MNENDEGEEMNSRMKVERGWKKKRKGILLKMEDAWRRYGVARELNALTLTWNVSAHVREDEHDERQVIGPWNWMPPYCWKDGCSVVDCPWYSHVPALHVHWHRHHHHPWYSHVQASKKDHSHSKTYSVEVALILNPSVHPSSSYPHPDSASQKKQNRTYLVQRRVGWNCFDWLLIQVGWNCFG